MIYSQENGSFFHFQNFNPETVEDKHYRKEQIGSYVSNCCNPSVVIKTFKHKRV